MRMENACKTEQKNIIKSYNQKTSTHEQEKPMDWETLFATTPTVDLRTETVKEEDWVW